MIPIIIATAIMCFLLFGLSILVHELGHVLIAKLYGKNPTIHLFDGKMIVLDEYSDLKRSQMASVYAGGVFAGMIPILAATWVWDISFAFLYIPYFYICRNDIKNLTQ